MDHDEFEFYFEKAAALQSLQASEAQGEEGTRRGSLPDSSGSRGGVSSLQAEDKHRRTFSCKVATRVIVGYFH